MDPADFEIGDGQNNLPTKNRTYDHDLSVKLQLVVERFELDKRFKIGANDLLDAFRTFDGEYEDFASSAEHLAFYLESNEAGSIKYPKAWFLKQLKRGYYPPPAGFKSWEERQQEARLAAILQKKERLAAMQQQKGDAEFDIWLMELTDDRRLQLLAGLPNNNPTSPFVRAKLREAFDQEKASLRTASAAP